MKIDLKHHMRSSKEQILTKKNNSTFMLLSAIGIIMVVDAHSGIPGEYDPLSLFESILPYNSFFMPMFVFISGYFIHIHEDLSKLPNMRIKLRYWIKWILKKIKRLVVPYYIFGLVFGLIGTLLYHVGFLYFDYYDGVQGVINYLYDSLTNGSYFAVCFPMWFLMALFMSYLLYSVIRIVASRIWNDMVAFALFVGVGFMLIYYCQSVDYKYCAILQLFFKGMFFLQFLQMGQIYKKYIEKHIISNKVKLIILFVIAVACVIFQLMFGRLTYSGLNNFKSFPILIPEMIVLWTTTVMGIVFWLTISEWLAPLVVNNALINYISNNTLWILCTHMACFRIFNIFLLLINRLGEGFLDKYGFDEMLVRGDNWYHFLPIPQFSVIYFIVGIVGSIGSKLLYDKVKHLVLIRICGK